MPLRHGVRPWKIFQARIKNAVVQVCGMTRLLQALQGILQSRDVSSSRLPKLHVATKSHEERAIGQRPHDSIEKHLRGQFFAADGPVDGVTHVEEQTDPQRQVFGTRKLPNPVNGYLVVEYSDVAGREVRDQAATIIGCAELEPHFRRCSTDRVSGSRSTSVP